MKLDLGKHGKHIMLTASSVTLLRPSENDPIKKVVSYFRERTHFMDALLNEEPIYIAGEILGVDYREIDAYPATFWTKYNDIYEMFSNG